ncbi:MFS transporter, partial [Thioclava sp. BHET1]
MGLFLFLCAGVADGAMLPFFPLWAESSAQIPTAAIGLLFACYSGGELIAAPLIGGLADRIGRRPVLLCSAMGIGIGLGALSLASGVWSAAAFLLLAGLAESVFHPTILAMVADVTPAPRHRQWFARLRVASSCGAILGPLLGAMLASLSLRLVFLGVGATLLMAALAVLLLAPETRPDAEPEDEEEEESLAALLPAFRDRRMGGMLIWFLLFEIAGNWIETILPLYAHDRGLLSPSGVGLLFGYAAALTVCLQMAISRYLEGIAALRLTLGAGALTLSLIHI